MLDDHTLLLQVRRYIQTNRHPRAVASRSRWRQDIFPRDTRLRSSPPSGADRGSAGKPEPDPPTTTAAPVATPRRGNRRHELRARRRHNGLPLIASRPAAAHGPPRGSRPPRSAPLGSRPYHHPEIVVRSAKPADFVSQGAGLAQLPAHGRGSFLPFQASHKAAQVIASPVPSGRCRLAISPLMMAFFVSSRRRASSSRLRPSQHRPAPPSPRRSRAPRPDVP